MALRVSLEGQTLSGELQHLPSGGSQEGRSAGARAVTGRRSVALEQESSNAGCLFEPLFYLAGVVADRPSAEGANPQILPGGLAAPGVHIDRWYEAQSHHGRSRFDHRGVVAREHQQRSAHTSAHAEKGARVATAVCCLLSRS